MVLRGNCVKQSDFFANRKKFFKSNELTSDKTVPINEIVVSILVNKYPQEQITLFYFGWIRRNANLYPYGHYVGCGKIGHVEPFGPWRYELGSFIGMDFEI